MGMLDPSEDIRPKGFRWSPLIGVTYNNIPVGIIAVAICIIIYFASK